MLRFFDVKFIFFTLWDTPVSYLEFFGVLTGIAGVWLAAKAHIGNWPVSLINVTLSFFLFYQSQLYPDMFLQVFFFVSSGWGWWRWVHPKPEETDLKHELKISLLTPKEWITGSIATLIATILLGLFAQNLHILLPFIFRQPSAFPYLDSFTTVASIIATVWMIRKKIECWYVWILIDVISTYMYFVKDLRFYSLLYFIFCFLAIGGAIQWWRIYRGYDPPDSPLLKNKTKVDW